MVRVTRKIEFSAAHFYHNPEFSAEENRRVFGKCNNPHGHGHNYVLEVTIAGEPDPDDRHGARFEGTERNSPARSG